MPFAKSTCEGQEEYSYRPPNNAIPPQRGALLVRTVLTHHQIVRHNHANYREEHPLRHAMMKRIKNIGANIFNRSCALAEQTEPILDFLSKNLKYPGGTNRPPGS
jgi:hypothetical protein